MNVFVDTNVLLDVLAKRARFYDDSVAIWTLAEQRRICGMVSAISFTNIYYVVRKLRSRRVALRTMTQLRDTFTPVACDEQILNQAIDAGFDDFEDAVQYFSALRGDASCLVTRDAGDFPDPVIPVLSPAEFLVTHSFSPES